MVLSMLLMKVFMQHCCMLLQLLCDVQTFCQMQRLLLHLTAAFGMTNSL